MKVLNLVVILVITITVECKKTYRVGVFENDNKIADIYQYLLIIKQSALENLDLLVLPPPEVPLDTSAKKSDFSPLNYEKNIYTLSEMAKQTSMYVAVHLFGEFNGDVAKVNVIFDRNGTVIATYKKPLTTETRKNSEIGSFTSNFGVLFGVLQEEDLLLHNVGAFNNVKNFIVLGPSDKSLKGTNFASFWAYVTKSNFITSNHIFGSKSVRTNDAHFMIADLNKDGAVITAAAQAHPTTLMHSEDFSQCSIRPVDVEASIQGYEDTVCHEAFCCGFYVKSHLVGSSSNKINYALAALDGDQSYADNNLHVENCAVLAYTGLYEYVVDIRSSQEHSIVKFDTIIIIHNKTNISNNPVIVTENIITSKQFYFTTNNNIITIEIIDNTNLSVISEQTSNNTKDYITVENVTEFFDYIWIKIRIILFVVSIYILEMM